MDQAIKHCTAGIGIWEWASNDQGGEPDVVMACCGDVPTLETLAAVQLLRRHLPELKVRVINVVDLMRLQPREEHPHGLTDAEFDVLFTTDKPIIFAFHGYPWLIHRLTYRRTNHENLHVRGYKEEGHDDDAVRHGGAERPRPLPPRRGRDRPRAAARRARRLRQAGDPRQADRAQAVHRGARRGHARDQRLALGRSSPRRASGRARPKPTTSETRARCAGKPRHEGHARRPGPARARVLRAPAGSRRSRAARQLRHERPSRLVAARVVHRSPHPRDHAGDLRLPARAAHRRPALPRARTPTRCRRPPSARRSRCWRRTACRP